MVSGERRQKRKELVAPLVMGVLVCLSGAIVAGTRQEEVTLARVDVGDDKSNPGGQAFIPLIFNPTGGTEIATIITRIAFPNKLLSFEEVRKDVSTDLADADIHTGVKTDEKNPENSVLEVEVKGRTRNATAGGFVVNLIFKISREVPVGKTIELETVANALTTDDPPKPVDLAIKNGTIETIELPVLFACFFYMH
jgi:hypothetical protein